MKISYGERSSGGGSGIGLGSVIAAVLSYSVNKSIGWAIVHGVFSWFYVIYYACGGGR
jgi:hypothetical protein